jgi:ureidoglycolate hydrolase
MDDIKSPVDYSTIKAFILDGTRAINLKKGVWHDLPFLLTEKAEFIVLFEKETHEKDLEVVELKEKVELIL